MTHSCLRRHACAIERGGEVPFVVITPENSGFVQGGAVDTDIEVDVSNGQSGLEPGKNDALQRIDAIARSAAEETFGLRRDCPANDFTG